MTSRHMWSLVELWFLPPRLSRHAQSSNCAALCSFLLSVYLLPL